MKVKKRNVCNKKYKECKFYMPTNPVNSRCVRNGVISACEIEQKYYKKFQNQIDEYFQNNLRKKEN